jgi:hypothetical protein
MNTHKVEFFSGGSTLLTEGQAEAIKEQLKKGAEFINIGNDLVNVKSISRIGTHHATNQIRKVEENMMDIKLVEAGRYDLVDKKRELIKAKTIKHSIDKDRDFVDKVRLGNPEALRVYMELPEAPKVSGVIQSDGGDYYLNEAGEKMYS